MALWRGHYGPADLKLERSNVYDNTSKTSLSKGHSRSYGEWSNRSLYAITGALFGTGSSDVGTLAGWLES